MISFYPRYEFDLTIKKIVDKKEGELNQFGYNGGKKYEPEEVTAEELKFTSLSAVDVLRKLLDYIKSLNQ